MIFLIINRKRKGIEKEKTFNTLIIKLQLSYFIFIHIENSNFDNGKIYKIHLYYFQPT